MANFCSNCGAPIEQGASFCNSCGCPLPGNDTQRNQQQYQQQAYYQQTYQRPYMDPRINPAWPIRSKTAAGILALFLGGFGVHYFYLGQTGKGILMLVFFWTLIPEIIGFIQGIIILCMGDTEFALKYQVIPE